jgi:hypothetical protein
MTDNVFDAAYRLRAKKNAAAWPVFIVLISIATLLPIVVAPFTQHVMSDEYSALRVILVLNFVGANFHVASTGWFYIEPEMRAHFRAHPLRYFIVPALLIVGSAAMFQLVPPARGYLLAAFFSWQLWHYQKQNVGLLSFVAAGTGKRPALASLAMLAGISTLGALLLNAAVIAPDDVDLPFRFAIYGAFVGIVMTHFVLDAGIWRLRERFQRGYMRERFSFVFDR